MKGLEVAPWVGTRGGLGPTVSLWLLNWNNTLPLWARVLLVTFLPLLGFKDQGTKTKHNKKKKKEKSIFRHAASSSDSQMVLDCSHSNMYIQHLVTLISLGGNNV